MTTLTDLLRDASVEDIVNTLIKLEKGYDVGMALFEKNVSKEFPGPPPDYYPGREDQITITGYYSDRDGRLRAIRGLKEVFDISYREAQEHVNALDSGSKLTRILELKSCRETVAQLAHWGIEADVNPPSTHRRYLYLFPIPILPASYSCT